MDLKTTEEVRLPIRRVWQEITDFDGFGRMLQERGIDVTRSEQPDPPGLGTTWEGSFTRSGTTRQVSGEVVRFEPPHHIVIDIASGGLTGAVRADLTAGAQGRTHVVVDLQLKARTMTARIFLQPLKLAHATMQARFAARVGEVARSMERRRRKR